jgi:hypothetical protein
VVCKTCHTEKPRGEFHRSHAKRGHERICKSCRHQRQAEVRKGKHPARMQLTHAVGRQAILVRPDACERCGAEGAVEGHHADYSKPLEVEWLCRSCHRLHHEREKRAAA